MAALLSPKLNKPSVIPLDYKSSSTFYNQDIYATLSPSAHMFRSSSKAKSKTIKYMTSTPKPSQQVTKFNVNILDQRPKRLLSRTPTGKPPLTSQSRINLISKFDDFAKNMLLTEESPIISQLKTHTMKLIRLKPTKNEKNYTSSDENHIDLSHQSHRKTLSMESGLLTPIPGVKN